jgi:predicted transcriptional regulator
MRIQVNVSDELVAQLDEYAKAVGMSRSGLCTFFIGQGMFSLNKGLEMASSAIQSYAVAAGSFVKDDVEELKLSSDDDVIKDK